MICRMIKKRSAQRRERIEARRVAELRAAAEAAAQDALVPADGAIKRLAGGTDVSALFETSWAGGGRPRGDVCAVLRRDALLARDGVRLYLLPAGEYLGDQALIDFNSRHGSSVKNLVLYPAGGMAIALCAVTMYFFDTPGVWRVR